MKIIDALTSPFSMRLSIAAQIATVLILSMVFWASGAPSWLNQSQAASFFDASDTLTDSDLAVVAGHTFTFTVPSRIETNAGGTATGTIAFDLAPGAPAAFTIGQLGAEDFSATTSIAIVANCTQGGGAAIKALVSTTSETFTLNLCASNAIGTSTGPYSFFIASTSGPITNPASVGSYDITMDSTNYDGAAKDSVDLQVAIINDVVVTASVDTTFSFTIAGLPTGVSINGTTTNVTTLASAETIPFGTLTAGAPKVAGQRLNVTTNASNGFTVTVQANDTLRSSNSDTIDVFADGNGTTTPSAWVAPAGTFGTVSTYGHWGLTSDDDINSNEFGSSDTRYAGNFSTSSRAVFHHNAPANGTTDNIGSTTVAYAIQTTPFQEAADDYTATLTYVATPVF